MTTNPTRHTGRQANPSVADMATRQLALGEVLGDSFLSVYSRAMEMMEWAEDEITRASNTHPELADRLWHSFKLLEPTHDLMKTEFVYRSHCRELLERVVATQDTRPGTAAECCIACCETSQLGPFTMAATGLYMRLCSAAGFPDVDFPREHYEAIRGRQIDEHEQALRRRLRRATRHLPKVIEHSARCPATRAGSATERQARRTA